MATTISICNMALAEVGADSIASLDEASVSARECARVFGQCLAELLEWTDWSFAIKRAALAAVPNDRPAEWAHAYALPGDLGTPVRVRRHADGPVPPSAAFPAGAPFTLPAQDAMPITFLIAGGRLYCNVAPAILEYGRSAVETSELPALLARALALEIAARIAFPIKKDARLKDGLIRQAEVAKGRALADDENRHPRRATAYVSDVDHARLGVADEPLGGC